MLYFGSKTGSSVIMGWWRCRVLLLVQSLLLAVTLYLATSGILEVSLHHQVTITSILITLNEGV